MHDMEHEETEARPLGLSAAYSTPGNDKNSKGDSNCF